MVNRALLAICSGFVCFYAGASLWLAAAGAWPGAVLFAVLAVLASWTRGTARFLLAPGPAPAAAGPWTAGETAALDGLAPLGEQLAAAPRTTGRDLG